MVTRIGEPIAVPEAPQDADFAYENYPFDAYSERLGQLITVSPALAAELQPQLQAAIDEAMMSCITPHEREAMAYTGEIISWKLFGKYNEQPPAILEKYNYEDDNDGLWRFGIRSGYSFAYPCMTASVELLDSAVVKSIEEATSADILTRKSEIEEALSGIIAHSEMFQYLQSFTVDTPHVIETPLSPFERAIRESVIDRQYGIDATTRRLLQDRYAAREKARLDDILITKTDYATTDEQVARAQAFFADELKRVCTDDVTDAHVVSINATGTSPALYMKKQDGTMQEIDNEMYELADEITNERIFAPTLTHVDMQTALFREFVSYLFLEETGKTMSSVLGRAVRAVRASYAELVSKVRTITSYDDHITELRTLDGPVTSYNSMQAAPEYKHPDHSSRLTNQYLSQQRIEALSNEIEGYIVQADPTNRHYRLIQSTPAVERDHPLPRIAPHEDLVLSKNVPLDHELTVPGYTLVSRDNTYFGFMHDPEGDPYESYEIELPHDAIAPLADEYSEIGLHELAALLHCGSVVNVQELVKAIQKQSVYHVPQDYDVSRAAYNIQHFSDSIRDGKLSVQCTGSAAFLAASLNKLFDTGASVIDGHVLGFGDDIRALQHAQVLFRHNGRAMIFDATALRTVDAAGAGSSAYQPRGGGVTRPPHAPGKRPLVESKNRKTAAATAETVDLLALRTIGLTAIRSHVEAQLSVITGARHRHELYERVVRLQQDDPLRRMMEAVIRAERDTDAQALLSEAAYFESYASADPTTLRLGLRRYDTALLRSFSSTARRLSRLIMDTQPS